ncbi:unnamed protein product [Polarella glacialis]|uniref:Uncharacterized protein n=1 Tax=Polarella glacialis TaxID=89957 RepID=A0A813HZD7_POLGL|nr:unnamed protein product [Polarella glacialis]
MSAAMLRIGASKAKCQSSGLGLIVLATCLSMGHARTAYTCKVYNSVGCTAPPADSFTFTRQGSDEGATQCYEISSHPWDAKSAKFLCDLPMELFGSADCSGEKWYSIDLGYGFYREKACATSIAHSIAAVAALLLNPWARHAACSCPGIKHVICFVQLFVPLPLPSLLFSSLLLLLLLLLLPCSSPSSSWSSFFF